MQAKDKTLQNLERLLSAAGHYRHLRALPLAPHIRNQQLRGAWFPLLHFSGPLALLGGLIFLPPPLEMRLWHQNQRKRSRNPLGVASYKDPRAHNVSPLQDPEVVRYVWPNVHDNIHSGSPPAACLPQHLREVRLKAERFRPWLISMIPCLGFYLLGHTRVRIHQFSARSRY